MTIELTEQQRRMVEGQNGRPIEVVDPDSQRSYMLIARDQFEKVRFMLEDSLAEAASPSQISLEIPPGIRRSQEAFWRDLPQLLEQRKLRGQRVCYHGDEQIGIARKSTELYERCRKRGLKECEFQVFIIEERGTPPWEPTVLEESLFEATDLTDAPLSASQIPLEIPPGIRRSQEAFWRDLPELLKQRKLRGQWVCYYGDERVGISRKRAELFRRCRERGIKEWDFDVFVIEEREMPPWEPMVLEESLFEAVEIQQLTPPTAP